MLETASKVTDVRLVPCCSSNSWWKPCQASLPMLSCSRSVTFQLLLVARQRPRPSAAIPCPWTNLWRLEDRKWAEHCRQGQLQQLRCGQNCACIMMVSGLQPRLQLGCGQNCACVNTVSGLQPRPPAATWLWTKLCLCEHCQWTAAKAACSSCLHKQDHGGRRLNIAAMANCSNCLHEQDHGGKRLKLQPRPTAETETWRPCLHGLVLRHSRIVLRCLTWWY